MLRKTIGLTTMRAQGTRTHPYTLRLAVTKEPPRGLLLTFYTSVNLIFTTLLAGQ